MIFAAQVKTPIPWKKKNTTNPIPWKPVDCMGGRLSSLNIESLSNRVVYPHVENFTAHMVVSENSGTPKSSILIGFSFINHPFWGTPVLGNPHVVHQKMMICSLKDDFLSSSLKKTFQTRNNLNTKSNFFNKVVVFG